MRGAEKITAILKSIYGPARGNEACQRILPLLQAFPAGESPAAGGLSQADAVLITYGDTLNQPGEPPLQTLGRFARNYLRPAFSAIHILPFFPFSSDDGFSVTDFSTVDPRLGQWADINRLGRDFDLMFDLVLNHVSSQNDWFRRYLNQEPGYTDLALDVDPGLDLSHITRPRTTPLLTPFRKTDGRTVHLWTTFSADQIDLNYQSLDVLEKMIGVLLFYVRQGARFIRLDAVAYLWKETATTCIHCLQTHDMVKLFRAVLDSVAPGVSLITETNVPHHENIRYFGDGRDEARMVYNFTLPPLLLYTFVTGDATALGRWAHDLAPPSAETAFFNFTASHDGIGVRPLEGILPASAVDLLAARAESNGGAVSSRCRADGGQTPYELNITYLDALGGPGDDDAKRAARFLASQAVALVLPGVPGVYVHSLLGSRNWSEGVRQTGRARTINRQPLALETVAREIATPGKLRHLVFHAYCRLLSLRRQQPAFHPAASAEVLDLSPRCFAMRRACADQTILTLTNVSAQSLTLELPAALVPGTTDLISGTALGGRTVHQKPFGVMWLASQPGQTRNQTRT